jgi:hypothetical protein
MAAQDTDWKNSVSDGLAAILNELSDIDNYLHSIPGIFKTVLDDEQRKLWKTQIQTNVSDINDLIKDNPHGPNTAILKEDWDKALTHIKSLVEDNMDYPDWGFEQFAIVAVGISAASGIAKYLSDRSKFRDLVDHGLVYYKAALDINVDDSFKTVNQNATTVRSQLVATYDPYFNTFWSTGQGEESSPPHGPPHGVVFLFNYPGSVETGLGQPIPKTVSDHTNPPFMPGTSGENAQDEAYNILSSAVAEYNSLSQTIVQSQACMNSCQTIIQELTRMKALLSLSSVK